MVYRVDSPPVPTVAVSSTSSPRVFSEPFRDLTSVQLLEPLLLVISVPHSENEKLVSTTVTISRLPVQRDRAKE